MTTQAQAGGSVRSDPDSSERMDRLPETSSGTREGVREIVD